MPISGLPLDLRSLAADIHASNIAAGWWKQEQYTVPGTFTFAPLWRTIPRNVGELLALVHSEISEADHGYELGLMDDKLPHRRMVEVELADVAIRVLDMLGYYAAEWPEEGGQQPLPLPETPDWPDWCRIMHRKTTVALEHFRKQRVREACIALDELLGIIHFCAIIFRLDLTGAITEKRAFNATRADHKPEARAADGGKTF